MTNRCSLAHPSAAYRLKKYVRKHRVLIGAVAAVLGALAIGFARTEYQRRIATVQRDRAEENLRLAQELVDKVIRPAAEQMADIPFTRDTQREALEQARDFYERILGQVEGDPEPRRQLAWIYQKLGHIAWCTDSPDCEPALRRSIAILEDLSREFPHHPDDRLARSWSHYWLTAWFWADLRFEEALPESRASIALAEDLVAQFPTTDEYRFALTCGEFQLAQALEGVGKLDEAERHYRTTFTGEGLHRWVRVAGRNGLCSVLMQLGRYDEAQPVLQEALQIAQRELAPDASAGREDFGKNIYRLALCHRLLGLHRFYTARWEEAQRHLRDAIDFFQRLSGAYPVTVRVPVRLGSWYHDLAEILTATGRLEDAEGARRQSLAAWESAPTAGTAAFSHGKGLAHYRLGELLHQTGRTEEARRQFTQAQAIMEDLARRRPREPDCHWQLICLLANCPDESLRDPRARSPWPSASCRHRLDTTGVIWRWPSTGASSGKRQPNRFSRRWSLRQGGDAFDWFLLAMSQWRLGQNEQAVEWYTQAQEAIEIGKPLFYEYLGVMAVQRLQKEAEGLLGERRENAGEEGRVRSTETGSWHGLEMDERYAWN